VDVSADTRGDQDTALSACYAAAAAGTDLFGERAGSPALRLVDPSLARPHEPVAIAYGVNVHAAVRVHGNDRAQLARLCRYLGRPPIAEERLTRTDDGRLRYELKRAWNTATGLSAWLLRHIWQVDVGTCSRCGGPMKWVEVATEPDAIRRVLAELERPRSEDGPAERPSTSRRVRLVPPEQLRLGFG
jgi:hypothetical protein